MEQQDNNATVQERSALKQEIEDQQQMIAKKTHVTKKSKKTITGRMLPINQLHLAILKLEKQPALSGKDINKLKAHNKALKKLVGLNNADTISNTARHKHLEDNKLALCMLKSKMSALNTLLEGEEPECLVDSDEQAMAKYEDEMAKHNKESDEQVGDEEDTGDKPGNDDMDDMSGEGNEVNESSQGNESAQGSQSGQVKAIVKCEVGEI